MINEKDIWIKSSISFNETSAYALNSVKLNLDTNSKEKVNYQIMRLCLYVGIKLNAEERRQLSDVSLKVEEDKGVYRTFSVPVSVLQNHEFDLKMMLFSVSINEMKNDINVKKLQEQWNSPSLKKENEYVSKFYEYIENGALYIYKILEVDKHPSLKANELIFGILSRTHQGGNVADDEGIDIFTYRG